ncbi:MaoC family dehydratase N-terminal domain-containing protein [Rhodococcus sp. KBS0724]|uniref:FAS1-like dehydratase domain-containing protein n=1 Tax=Rhodococcus sp. KBS0724 TaxID=1179674 RepID=UPI001C8F5F19|nr:MaoC family dehydratase N-terminal domain-containing protein [Rhodococcus sp. KBS0724]
MPIDSSLVGLTSKPVWKTWTSTDALLYALGVGAGQADPLDELEFTTENSEGIAQKVLPTFANVVFSGGGDGPALPDDVDYSKLLHASQSFNLTGPLPTDGRVETTRTITGVYDKGSGALLTMEIVARDSAGQVVGTHRVRVVLPRLRRVRRRSRAVNHLGTADPQAGSRCHANNSTGPGAALPTQ